ncbi:hypothetical protein EPI10_020733 [Gossypium australe]|uniref:Uncharacterized protein n=1 Tax=Gossypium australe TaxID=47621 RepID=A0A5B6WGT8_9ROSI|nr:hypothetical protein EPI10_020733 [Gossypium australe]
MNINGETEIFKCGHQQSEENRRKLREHCNEISILQPNYPESRDVLFVTSTSRNNRFKERGKQKKVEWHDGRWTNTKGNRSVKAFLKLLDESGSKT